MRSFESLVESLMTMTEEVQIPPGSLKVPRSRLPQIKSEKIPEFLDYLRANGVTVRVETVPACRLHGTQAEVDLEKIKGMMAAGISSDSKPLIASADDFIMDGHHRWMADYNVNKQTPVKIYRCGVPIRGLIAFARKFDGVFYKEMGESSRLTPA